MKCIYCENKTRTINSRQMKNNYRVWRRLECKSCHNIYTTEETPVFSTVKIIKDNKKSDFNIGKIIICIYKSSSHNPKLATENGFDLAMTVFNKIISDNNNVTITSNKLKNILYTTLKNFDELMALQYGAQEGIVTSTRKGPGRPSIKNTN